MPSIYHLEGSRDRAFPSFEKPRIPCPTSTFSGFVKQVRPAELSTLERNFLNAALGGFLESAKPAGHVHAMLAALTPQASHEERLPRRYDGDRTLPHGRYYTVCKNAEGDDSGTLSSELMFYKRADVAGGHIEIFDPAIDGQREMIGRLGMDMSARELSSLRSPRLHSLRTQLRRSILSFPFPSKFVNCTWKTCSTSGGLQLSIGSLHHSQSGNCSKSKRRYAALLSLAQETNRVHRGSSIVAGSITRGRKLR